MTDEELAALLEGTLMLVPFGQKTNAYVLFGIKYAEELAGRSARVVEVARRARRDSRAARTAATDIDYGVRLAPYVVIPEPPPVWLA